MITPVPIMFNNTSPSNSSKGLLITQLLGLLVLFFVIIYIGGIGWYYVDDDVTVNPNNTVSHYITIWHNANIIYSNYGHYDTPIDKQDLVNASIKVECDSAIAQYKRLK